MCSLTENIQVSNTQDKVNIYRKEKEKEKMASRMRRKDVADDKVVLQKTPTSTFRTNRQSSKAKAFN